MRISTRSAVRSLILFSVLLPVLPLCAFYSIYYGVLDRHLGLEFASESSRGLASALTAVGVVNLIVFLFVFVAYTEEEPEPVPSEEVPEESKKEQ